MALVKDPEHAFNTDPNEDNNNEDTQGVSVQDVGKEQEHVILLGGDDKGTVGVSGYVPGGEKKEVTIGGLDEGYSRGQAEEEMAFAVLEEVEKQESVRAVDVDEENIAAGRDEELENARVEGFEGQEEIGTVRAEELGGVELGNRRGEEMKGEEEKKVKAEDTEEGGEEDNLRAEETEEGEEEISDEE